MGENVLKFGENCRFTADIDSRDLFLYVYSELEHRRYSAVRLRRKSICLQFYYVGRIDVSCFMNNFLLD